MANGKRYEIDDGGFAARIADSGHAIYNRIEPGDPRLWIPTAKLEAILDKGLRGFSVKGLPLKTRSKVLKQEVCKCLGYPVPDSFQKTHPRFPGQDFDTYIQKANNLQVWNEDLHPTRRYVIIRISPNGVVDRVKVVTGAALAKLDKTRKLTQKYQARMVSAGKGAELVSPKDTDLVNEIALKKAFPKRFAESPTAYPDETCVLPIREVFTRVKGLPDTRFPDVGFDQERNRGATLHRLVCERLGYPTYQDSGSIPDVTNQLLEVKLQTSPTIDLGLVTPDSREPLDIPMIGGRQIRHCDLRYLVVGAATDGTHVTLQSVYLVTGEDFFTRFSRFGGKVLNKKLQIPLPRDFFE